MSQQHLPDTRETTRPLNEDDLAKLAISKIEAFQGLLQDLIYDASDEVGLAVVQAAHNFAEAADKANQRKLLDLQLGLD